MNNENISQENGKKEPKWRRLWALQLTLNLDLSHLTEDAVRADALGSEFYAKEAEEYLAMVEDDIARYREGRPQGFQEDERRND